MDRSTDRPVRSPGSGEEVPGTRAPSPGSGDGRRGLTRRRSSARLPRSRWGGTERVDRGGDAGVDGRRVDVVAGPTEDVADLADVAGEDQPGALRSEQRVQPLDHLGGGHVD